VAAQTHKIAVIAGDGIGKEVIPAGIAALEAATKGTNIALSFSELPWGCEFYLKNGRMLDDDGFERLAKFDAIYLGAIGAPTVPDHISAGDLLLPLRKHFNQYINLRPMRLLSGLSSPLANRTAAAGGDPVPARRARPRGCGHALRPREHRRGVLRRRRAGPSWHDL
jgi:tartrate dehydrogenase/decarboxylase/D-malate dehydrogenase